MTGTYRIQLRRTKGWRKPPGVVVVSRPSKWGNPYRGTDDASRTEAAERFDRELRSCVADPFGASYPLQIRNIADDLHELAGKNLACWCPIGSICHADTLLDLAGQTVKP